MKSTRAWWLAVVAGCWAGASLGAAPATPSYIGIEAKIAQIKADSVKTGGDASPNMTGWNALFDAVGRDLQAYTSGKTEAERLTALGQLYQVSAALDGSTWEPARGLREELRAWLRPRVALAWAERRLLEAVRGIPDSADANSQKNRDNWVKFVGDDLGSALRGYEGAPDVRVRRESLGKVYAALNSLQSRNQAVAWGPSLVLQGALNDLYNAPNMQATADANAVAPRLANYVVETGPITRDGQTAYITAGPFLGFGLMASDDGIMFYNRQALSSVTNINGFQQQVASDKQGKQAAKLYQFGATSYDQSVLTVIAVVRPTGLELFPQSSHGISASVGSAPQPGKGLGRAIASLIGLNQAKITQKVYDGAIPKIRSGIIQGSAEEAAEKTALREAETNAQLAQVFTDPNTLAVRNFEVDHLKLRSRPEFVIVNGTVQWRGAGEQVGADLPKPARFGAVEPGVTADIHLASIATNLTRGFLQGDQAQATKNLLIVTKKVPDGAPPRDGIETSQNVDYPTFLKAVDAAQVANDPKVLAVRIKRPGRSPEFSVDRNGFLVAIVHDFEIEVPAPPSARQGGGLSGPAARVYRLAAKDAEFVISFEVQPARDNVPIRLSGRIENFDPGPVYQVSALNEDESKAEPLNAFTGRIVLGVFGGKLKGQPIDAPLGDLNIQGFTLTSVSKLDPTGWLRVVLTPSGSQPAGAP